MKGKIILFIVLVLFWLIISGRFDVAHILIGCLCSAFVVLVTGTFILANIYVRQPTGECFRFLMIVPVFLWDFIKGSCDAAAGLLFLQPPVNPAIVRVKTQLRSDTALMLLSNILTLLPGMMTVDVVQRNGYIYIHSLALKNEIREKKAQALVIKYEGLIRKLLV